MYDLLFLPRIVQNSVNIPVESGCMTIFQVIPHDRTGQEPPCQKVFVCGITTIYRISEHKNQLAVRSKIPADVSGTAGKGKSRIDFTNDPRIIGGKVSVITVQIKRLPTEHPQSTDTIIHGFLHITAQRNIFMLVQDFI